MSKLRNIFGWAVFLLIALGLAVFGVNYLVPENEGEQLMGAAQFGMSPQEVAKLEEDKEPALQAEENAILVVGYPTEFDKVPASVFYGFVKNKLSIINYQIALYQPKQPAPVQDYLGWVKLFEQVYGQPTKIMRAWDKNPDVLKQPGGGILASCRWEQAAMVVEIALCYPEFERFPPEANMPTIEIFYRQKGPDFLRHLTVGRLTFYTQWNVPLKYNMSKPSF